MPVTLLFFSAETSAANLVKLSWATIQEQNAAYFGIERSMNAYDFTETAQITAKGSNDATTAYLHTDESPFRGRSYYRLRQVDLDGSYRYSKIVTVRTTGADGTYPNHIKNNVIRIEAREGSLLKLADLNGREVSFKTKRINEELLELQPTPNLGPGVYIISVNGMRHRVLVQ